MQDSWEAGDPYEYFMGRWSRLVADGFVAWLPTSSRLSWLDVGCGTGALSEAIVKSHKPMIVNAIDQSPGFTQTTQRRLGARAQCQVGDALALPLSTSSVDVTVSGLLLNFIPEPGEALEEMKRVTRANGMVALYVWDYAGKMEFLQHFWDAAVEVEPDASALHESKRFSNANRARLQALFETAELAEIETAPIEITTRFRNFDDYWKPFLGGQGPAPTFVMSLDEPRRVDLRESLQQRLPAQSDGSISLSARAWAIRGRLLK